MVFQYKKNATISVLSLHSNYISLTYCTHPSIMLSTCPLSADRQPNTLTFTPVASLLSPILFSLGWWEDIAVHFFSLHDMLVQHSGQ